jgi:pyruvyl transferase EpsO
MGNAMTSFLPNDPDIVKHSHASIMTSLAERHWQISPLVVGRSVHYVDIPFHGNIGDLLILQGTLEFFRKNSIDLKSISAFFNFSPKWVDPEDVVVFHGGGNFGDLYKGPQQIRELCVDQLRNNRIVVLPQTIHFRSDVAYRRCCELMSRHPDLHICVRDRRSHDLARKMTGNVYLLPDMAHQLWPLNSKNNSPKRRIGIFRTDGERRPGGVEEADDVTDWPNLVGYRDRIFPVLQKCMRALHLLSLDKRLVTTEMRLWIFYADRLVSEAIELLSNYDDVATDRLHGHILACLMNKRNLVIDNSYGKNSQYTEQWTAGSDLVRRRS